jgi:hypothetical protein
MRLAIVITLAACSVFATDKMEKQRNKLAQAIGEANKELAAAQKLRDKKVKRLLSQYVAALKKVQVYWTKKGDLDNALKVRDEMRKVHGLLNPPPISGPLPAMTSDSMVSQKLRSATPPAHYRGLQFSREDRTTYQLFTRFRKQMMGWPTKERDRLATAFHKWRHWRDLN